MKNRILILTIMFTLFMGIGYAQNQVSSEFNIYNLNGTWELQSKWNDKNIVFVKTTNDKEYVGPIIKFSNDGNMIFGYSLNSIKCGNDHRLKKRKGDWNFDEESMIFQTSVSIANFGTEFKLIELNSNKLVLNKLSIE